MPVLLVHGMGRTSLSLHRLARYLQRSGYPAHLAGYVASVERFARIVQRIRNRLAVMGADGKQYVVIGHSLGGLLVRTALAGLSAGAQPSFFDRLPPLSVPYTIIAGSRGWVGRSSPCMSEPNDGLVAVSETRVCSKDVPLVLPVRHTFMMNDPRVREVIRKVLEGVGDITVAVD